MVMAITVAIAPTTKIENLSIQTNSNSVACVCISTKYCTFVGIMLKVFNVFD